MTDLAPTCGTDLGTALAWKLVQAGRKTQSDPSIQAQRFEIGAKYFCNQAGFEPGSFRFPQSALDDGPVVVSRFCQIEAKVSPIIHQQMLLNRFFSGLFATAAVVLALMRRGATA